MARAKEEEAAAAAEGSEEATEEKASKKAAKPEGFVSPYEFSTILSEHLGVETPIRPQTIYGFVRNEVKNPDGTPFPFQKNTDGRYMVDAAAALVWYDSRKEQIAARKAANAAKKAAASEAEAAAEEA